MSQKDAADAHFAHALKYYEETEEYDKALAECDQAIELDPYLADAHNLRGIILEDLGRLIDAIDAYREAIRLDPDFSEARENLSALEAEFATPSRLVTIATFSYPTEAHILRARLESEGIWSFVAGENIVTANWLFSNAVGGVRLQVRADDAEKALEILSEEPEPIEWDEEDIVDEEDEPTRCPRCNSTRIHYEKYAKRPVFLSWLLLGFPVPFLSDKWECRECGFRWKESKT